MTRTGLNMCFKGQWEHLQIYVVVFCGQFCEILWTLERKILAAEQKVRGYTDQLAQGWVFDQGLYFPVLP